MTFGPTTTIQFALESDLLEIEQDLGEITAFLGGLGGLATHGVLISEGVNPMNALVGTTGQTLMGVTGSDPIFTSSPAFGGQVSSGTPGSTGGKFSALGSTSGSAGFLANSTGSLTIFNNQGGQALNFTDGGNGTTFIINGAAGSIANTVRVTPAQTGTNPSVSVGGSDTNVGLTLVTQGTGNVQTAAPFLHTGTGTPTLAAGQLGITGSITTPALGTGNTGLLSLAAADGLVLQGNGSTFDIILTNHNGTAALGVNSGALGITVNNGGIAILGATSGSITHKSAATAGSNTITWPAGTTDFSATGGTNQVVQQGSAGGAFTVGQLAFTQLSGTLQVNQGGTGATTFTAHGVLLGEGTAAFGVTAVGATGNALMGNTGADPTWTGAPSFATSATAPFFNATTTATGYELGGTSVMVTNGNYTQINPPPNQTSAALLLVGNATDPQVYVRGNFIVQTVGGVQVNSLGANGTLSMGGSTPAVSGIINLSGSTSGTVTIQPQAAAGTWNFNLPITAGVAGQVLTSQGGGSTAMTWSTVSTRTAPQISVFTSGSSLTYTTPANTLYLMVEGVGGGGGGGGSGTAGGGAATAGNATTFSGGAITLTGNGGAAGTSNGGGTYAAGGSATGGDVNITGASGGAGNSTSNQSGPYGGGSYFGGGGASNNLNGAGGAGQAPGAGGGGASMAINTAGDIGGGGGAGGYFRKLITSPNATYTYTVGASAAGGTAGTSGFAGGAGAAGIIIVVAYFN